MSLVDVLIVMFEFIRPIISKSKMCLRDYRYFPSLNKLCTSLKHILALPTYGETFIVSEIYVAILNFKASTFQNQSPCKRYSTFFRILKLYQYQTEDIQIHPDYLLGTAR